MLADADDVAHELGLEDEAALSPAQAARVPGLLAKASRLFCMAADRQFETGTYTVRLKVNGGQVRLPESPVTDVASVVDDSENAVSYTRRGQWLIVDTTFDSDRSFAALPPRGSDAFVTVTYTGGEVPDEVKAAVAQMVVRQMSLHPMAATGAKSIQLGADEFTARIDFHDKAAETMSLSDEDRELAESYRYHGTQVVVLRP